MDIKFHWSIHCPVSKLIFYSLLRCGIILESFTIRQTRQANFTWTHNWVNIVREKENTVQESFNGFLTLWNEKDSMVLTTVPKELVTHAKKLQEKSHISLFLINLRPELESVKAALTNREVSRDLDTCVQEVLRVFFICITIWWVESKVGYLRKVFWHDINFLQISNYSIWHVWKEKSIAYDILIFLKERKKERKRNTILFRLEISPWVQVPKFKIKRPNQDGDHLSNPNFGMVDGKSRGSSLFP